MMAPQRQLFGTDGIRGVAGEFPLDKRTVFAIGSALGHRLAAAGKHKRAVIGQDTRESSRWIANIIASGLMSAGIQVESAGVLTTPGIAYLARSNSFAAGTVNFTVNDNSNTALFSVAGIKPGDAPLSRCVTVTNAGSLPLRLNLYTGTLTGGLGSYLNLSVLRGSFGAAQVYPGCATFTSAGTVYTGTLAAFPTTAGSELSDGGGLLAAGATRAFQFDISLQDNTAAQGGSVSLPFTFDATQ